MTATECMVAALAEVLPKSKIYPIVPDTVQAPFVAYSEQAQPAKTYDGVAGGTTTTVLTVSASNKREARELADRIIAKLDGYASSGYAFYYTDMGFALYEQERLSTYELTFNILQ